MKPDLKYLHDNIRDIPDFPKKGIIFKDISLLLQDPAAFRSAVDGICRNYQKKKIDAVVCVEARGFVLGAAVAYKLNCGLVMVRKKGKLPGRTFQVTYALEYGTDTLEVHRDGIRPDQNVLIVDDVLATGGTVAAVCRLVKKSKANIEGAAFLLELEFLNGRKKLSSCTVFSLLKY